MEKRKSAEPPAGEPPAQRPRDDEPQFCARYQPVAGPPNSPEIMPFVLQQQAAMSVALNTRRIQPAGSIRFSAIPRGPIAFSAIPRGFVTIGPMSLPPIPETDAEWGRWHRASSQDILGVAQVSTEMATRGADEMLTGARPPPPEK